MRVPGNLSLLILACSLLAVGCQPPDVTVQHTLAPALPASMNVKTVAVEPFSVASGAGLMIWANSEPGGSAACRRWRSFR